MKERTEKLYTSLYILMHTIIQKVLNVTGLSLSLKESGALTEEVLVSAGAEDLIKGLTEEITSFTGNGPGCQAFTALTVEILTRVSDIVSEADLLL